LILGELDRLSDISSDGGRAQRGVPGTLSIFATHFPRFPVLPGVLLVNDLARLAAHVLGRRAGGSWALSEGGRIRFRSYVRPGDVVDLSVEVLECGEASAVCRATASVNGRTVCTAGLLRMGRET